MTPVHEQPLARNTSTNEEHPGWIIRGVLIKGYIVSAYFWTTNLSVKVFSPAVMLTMYRPLAISPLRSIAEFT